MYYHAWLQTAIGRLLLVKKEQALVCVSLFEEDHQTYVEYYHSKEDEQCLAEEQKQLAEYFAGERKVFTFPIAYEGTKFQTQVWDALLKIPYGMTQSYLDIAKQIDNPKAVRGVGQANKRNHLPIVIPCHRVISSKQTLIGYAGSHTNIQEQLLQLEKRYL